MNQILSKCKDKNLTIKSEAALISLIFRNSD